MGRRIRCSISSSETGTSSTSTIFFPQGPSVKSPGEMSMSRIEAIAACTLRPARLLGIEAERGTLRPGARADFAILDAGGKVVETWIAGERCYCSVSRCEILPP